MSKSFTSNSVPVEKQDPNKKPDTQVKSLTKDPDTKEPRIIARAGCVPYLAAMGLTMISFLKSENGTEFTIFSEGASFGLTSIICLIAGIGLFTRLYFLTFISSTAILATYIISAFRFKYSLVEPASFDIGFYLYSAAIAELAGISFILHLVHKDKIRRAIHAKTSKEENIEFVAEKKP
ncbi:MAG: hypothetical protein MJY87_00665 [Fibrobacter sp.]|nr:hypothetical protein [Fibrobacter sp.]